MMTMKLATHAMARINAGPRVRRRTAVTGRGVWRGGGSEMGHNSDSLREDLFGSVLIEQVQVEQVQVI
jgi:hypothetical protein